MIKASDLRKGNFVQCNGDIITVQNIGDHEINLEYNPVTGSYQSGILLEALQPIPLTPDWLERCGFEIKGGQKDCWNYSDKNGVALASEYRHAQWGWYYNSYEITTLHQLQNLYFALTGEELVITQPVT